MRNKIATVAAAVALAGAGVLASGSAASAATTPPGGGSWDHTWTTTDSGNGGTVYVEEHGDYISLCDTHADGYTPRAEIFVQGSSGQYNYRYSLKASGGYGACTTRDASDGGTYNLPEGIKIDVSIWLGPTVGTYGSEHIYLNDH